VTPFTEAWQQALAAEQQAVFGYSLLGPRLGSADQNTARSYLAAHEALRDTTAAAMLATGLTPHNPAVDYPDLYPVPAAAAARRLALYLEQDCAAAWRFAFLTASVTVSQARAQKLTDQGARRREAQAALTASAQRSTRWRVIAGQSPPSTAFPGT
jgi:hypothetical protein